MCLPTRAAGIWFDNGWGFDDYWGAGSSWDSFLPGPGGGYRDYNPILPGYCPPGYYHPIEDPYNCIPFPVQGAPGAPGGAGQGAAQGLGDLRAAHLLPLRLRLLLRVLPVLPYREQAGRCMPPACPEGQLFNPNTNKCEQGSFICSQLLLPALRQLVSERECPRGSGSCWGVLF
jgi:hypothetical protein